MMPSHCTPPPVFVCSWGVVAYRAAISTAVELSVAVPALRVGTLDLDVEVQGGGARGQVGEDGDVRGTGVILADTEVDRSPVAGRRRVRRAGPQAGVLDRDTHGVHVVLSSGRLALPDVVVGRDRVGQRIGTAGLGIEGDVHVLGRGVVGTADGSVSGELVLDRDAAGTLLADLGVAGTAELEESGRVAPEATDGLSRSALGSLGPLRLFVSGGASIRAERPGGASAGDGSDDVADSNTGDPATDLLNASPPTGANPGDRDRTVAAREGRAWDGAVGEAGGNAAGGRLAEGSSTYVDPGVGRSGRGA